MLYHTWTFALFLAVVYPVFLLVKETRLRVPWLLVSSYVFYAFASPLYLVLLLFATTVDYLAVLGMARTRWKRSFLTGAVLMNLSLLGFFKYARFVTDNVNWLLAKLHVGYAVNLSAATKGMGGAVEWLNGLLAHVGLPSMSVPGDILLPLGLSFFIFQSMTYSIDFYRGKVERELSFLHYAAFVSLFPQLLSGPIERARNLLPQLHKSATITAEDIADGASLFVVGLFKKVALADYLFLYVSKVYDAPGTQYSAALVLAGVAYAWQVYFDFSGYTDMARGVARLFGIRLMLNFDNPYLATGLADFWRRWHISLSTWFRDYLYIPLGGNRRGETRTYANMAITMVVSGLWHGATWTFVIWGALHAFYRVLTRKLESSQFYLERVPTFVKRLFVFALVTFAWIFFRAKSLADAWTIVRRIFTTGWSDPACPVLVLALIASVWLYQWLYESRLRWTLRPAPVKIGLVAGMLLYLMILRPTGIQQFIYFQF